MFWTVDGRQFDFVIASDEDGMLLEATELGDAEQVLVMEAFLSDVTHKMTFTAHVANIPFELVETFVAMARNRLPPMQDRTSS